MPLVATYGLRDLIPEWYAPKDAELLLTIRSFFRAELMTPIIVAVVSLFLGYFADLGLALFCRELYVKQQKLPFPLAEVSAHDNHHILLAWKRELDGGCYVGVGEGYG